MKHINLTALVCLSVAAFAQDVQFDYDRSANFNAYKTYQWVDYKAEFDHQAWPTSISSNLAHP